MKDYFHSNRSMVHQIFKTTKRMQGVQFGVQGSGVTGLAVGWPPTVIVVVSKRAPVIIIPLIVANAPPVLVISITINTAIRPPVTTGFGVPEVVEVNHEVLKVFPKAIAVAVIISARATRSTKVGCEILTTVRDLVSTFATSAQTLSFLHHSAVLARHIACCCILQGDKV